MSHEVIDYLEDSYVAVVGPKSTDGPAMIAAFERSLAAARRPPDELNDLLATASYLTAHTIYEGILPVADRVDEIIASGGGTHNKSIMNWLASRLNPTPIHITDDIGVSGPAKEALAFAPLAAVCSIQYARGHRCIAQCSAWFDYAKAVIGRSICRW